MSTRAERRLKEAQDAHQDALTTHQSATSRFNTLDAQADAGESVDPLEYATAEGAVKIAEKRLERTQRAVDQEEGIVAQERARATHRELVDAANRIPKFEDQAAPLTEAIADYADQVRGNAAAWDAVYHRVQTEIGAFPWDGEAKAVAASASGVPDMVRWHDSVTGPRPESQGRLLRDRFYLGGEVYRRPDMPFLEEQLHEEIRRVFRNLSNGASHTPAQGQGVAREDQRRSTPEPTPDAAA